MIHEGTLADRPHFMRLQHEFQKSQRELGSYFLADTHNLNLSRAMFERYAAGSLGGFTLFWTPESGDAPVGLLMAGSDINKNEWHLDLGKLCIMWSIYVEPEYRGQGITMKLFHHAMQIGVGMGYETIVTYVLSTNEHGGRVATEFGTRPVLVEHNASLLDAMKGADAKEGLGMETT